MSEQLEKAVDLMKRMRREWEEKKRKAQTPYAEMLHKGLGISEDDAYSILDTVVTYDEETPFDGLDNEAVCDLVGYYLDLFGSAKSLAAFLKAQQTIDNGPYEPYFRKKTLFFLSPKEKVGKLFDEICAFLNDTKENCVQFLIAKPGCLFRSFSYFEKHFVEAQDFWGLSKEETARFLIRYPMAFAKKTAYLDNRIKRINEYFQVDENKIKQLILTYPKLLERSTNYFKNNCVPDLVFEKPWILECITGYKDSNYGGYRTMENFLRYLAIVEQHFGKVVRVEDWRFGKNRLIGFITKLGDMTYYVSVGAGLITPELLQCPEERTTQEERLLRAIFGDKAIMPKTYQQELVSHKEIYAQIVDTEEAVEFLVEVRNMLETEFRHGAQFKSESDGFALCQKGYVIDQQHPAELNIPYDEEKNFNIRFSRLRILPDGRFRLTPHFHQTTTE